MQNLKLSTMGLLLIMLGIIFFIQNVFNINIYIEWKYIWPVILVAVGVNMIIKKNNK